MNFSIHDVGHGFCAHLKHDNGNVMVWDCGHKSNPEHRPSKFLPAAGISIIHRLFVTNYDEDHISDLPSLRMAARIQILHKNPSINPAQLRQLKLQSGPLSPAMSALLAMLNDYTGEVTDPPEFPGVSFESFWCNYPQDFSDTNNLSLVTCLETPGCNFVLPGDVEEPAWKKLLKNNAFRTKLARTNVFVASHHGRTNGYCKEVFEVCSPAVVVFSDGPQQHATQKEADTYAQHASGVTFNGRTRYVLTTRNDGTLSWTL